MKPVLNSINHLIFCLFVLTCAISFLFYSSSCSTKIKISSKINKYEESIKEGVWFTTCDSTNTLEFAEYKKGKLHGTYIKYFKDGKIAVKGKYRNGKKNGWWYYGGATSFSIKYRGDTIVTRKFSFPRF